MIEALHNDDDDDDDDDSDDDDHHNQRMKTQCNIVSMLVVWIFVRKYYT